MDKEHSGMHKLAQAEAIARANARPEPIVTDERAMRPRVEMPTQAEIFVLKKAYGLRTLGQAKQ